MRQRGSGTRSGGRGSGRGSGRGRRGLVRAARARGRGRHGLVRALRELEVPDVGPLLRNVDLCTIFYRRSGRVDPCTFCTSAPDLSQVLKVKIEHTYDWLKIFDAYQLDGRGLVDIWTKQKFEDYVDERLADLTRVGVNTDAIEEETPRWIYCLEQLKLDAKNAQKTKRRREAAARAEAERRQVIRDEQRRAKLRGKLDKGAAHVLKHAKSLGAFGSMGSLAAAKREAAEKKRREEERGISISRSATSVAYSARWVRANPRSRRVVEGTWPVVVTCLLKQGALVGASPAPDTGITINSNNVYKNKNSVPERPPPPPPPPQHEQLLDPARERIQRDRRRDVVPRVEGVEERVIAVRAAARLARVEHDAPLKCLKRIDSHGRRRREDQQQRGVRAGSHRGQAVPSHNGMHGGPAAG